MNLKKCTLKDLILDVAFSLKMSMYTIENASSIFEGWKKIWKILSLRLKWFIIRKIPVFSYSYPYTKDEGSTSILSCSWCQIFILWRYKHALEREKVQFLKDDKLCWTIFSFRLKKDSLYNIIYISSYFMCCP